MDGMMEFFRQGYSSANGIQNDMQLDFPERQIVEVSVNADGGNMFEMMEGKNCCGCCRHGDPCEDEKTSGFIDSSYANVQIDAPDIEL